MTERTTRLGPMRAEVLHVLRELAEPAPVAKVAAVVGLHPNTTRFHLDALTDAGLVLRAVEQRTRPGRPKVLYQAAHGHRPNRYQELAGAMVRHFAGGLADRSERARAAGEAWGEELRKDLQRALPEQEPLDRLVGCMSELGYEPRLETEPAPVIALRPCPFLDLAGADPDVVCQLHLGLARGVLGPGQPWEVTRIQPWVGPDRCLMHLSCARIAAGGGRRADAQGSPADA